VAKLNEITAPGYLERLEVWPLDVLRSPRHEATEVETGQLETGKASVDSLLS
jgi:hypothetical protein